MSESAPSENRPERLDSIDRWDEEVDVVVIGYGGAGVCAALEAAGTGARVLALERAGGPGGTTATSIGHLYLGGGTRVQKACGIEDSAEEMFKFVMACAEEPDEERTRIFCDESVSHFDWLVSLGVPFKDSLYPDRVLAQPTDDCLIWSGNEKAHPFREIARPAPRGHKVQADGEGGPVLIRVLAEAAERAGIELWCDTRAQSLVLSADGRVCGVVARRDGEERRICARRGVVLCAGGFAMNTEMVRNHAPRLLTPGVSRLGNPYDDGAGIRMGLAARGAAIHMSEAFLNLPYYPPSSLTKGILINAQGQRFVNEDSYHGRCGAFASRQPDGRVYLVVDDGCFAYPDSKLELVATEGSIAELEAALGLPTTMLQHTVEVYNRHATRGEDPLFHKQPEWLKPLDEPPFAAIECSFGKVLYGAFTLGGLRTRPSGEVLDEDGSPIAGLYAAGRNACGIPRSDWGYCSGTSIADATLFGRKAGVAAARSAPWK
jgi:succinate dehydrogenase/fumarate reductase flavoprotein subunit